jgi:glycine/D-amino acid oxidase-like deaminating enzyme
VRPIRTGAVDRCLWGDLPPPPPPAPPPPGGVDVAIVGGGYTGLAAARALARHGARVAVLERHAIGWGASGRNGGFVLPGFQRGLAGLAARVGERRARELFEWSGEAVGALEALLAAEAIDCGYARCGSVLLAARAGHLAALEEERRCLDRVAGHATELLGPEGVRREIGSRGYHGGLVDPAGGALHPGRYCAGLAAAAERAGASLHPGAEVTAIRRTADGIELATPAGPWRAAEVLVATDGYTGPPFARLRRRVIPVGSYLIATAPLDPSLASRLIPRGRVMSDTRNLLYYFRLSPDGRMVFGGRTSMTPVGTARAARALGAAMRQVFPELAATPVDFAWSGSVGFTLDRMPHAGRLDGIHYALGYCGHGVAFATWLGGRMGEALAGRGTIPDLGPLRAVPLYGGTPWFLPFVDAYYRLRDGIG